MSSDLRPLPAKGVVYTPEAIADAVTRTALDNYEGVPSRILEPSVGEGAFLKSLARHEIGGSCITAVDVDGVVIDRVRTCYEGIGAIHGDFLKYALELDGGSFDLVIGNPPFLKRADCELGFRRRLAEVSERTGFPVGQLKNAWAAFAVVATDLVDSGGVLALVLPHQLLTAQYGRAVQTHLVRSGFDLDVFAPDSRAFSSIEQHAVVLIARRSADELGTVRVLRVREFWNLEPSASATVNIAESRAASIDVKSVLLDAETTDLLRRIRSDWGQVSDCCETAAGIVTAANRDFILRDADAERLGLRPWVRRILQKGSHLPSGPVFSREDSERLTSTVPCNLVDLCGEGLPPLSDEARSFIEDCEERGIHERYKCQRRSPWYRIPIVSAGDGLFFKRANVYPRLCVNEASILATDAAYQIRMIEGHAIRDLCFSFYNSITLLFAEVDGRSYFSGVLELTPTEFRGLPLHLLSPTTEEFAAFETTFSTSSDDCERICAACDRRLCEESGIREIEMRRARKALEALREHRRRHRNVRNEAAVQRDGAVDGSRRVVRDSPRAAFCRR